MDKMELPDISTLDRHISYCRETGYFYWKIARRGRRKSIPAGTVRHDGYVIIGLDGVHYYAHRLAWLIHYRSAPDREIDHIDGNTSNNSIVNLRLSLRYQNAQNAGPHSNNTSGYKGVDIHKPTGKWRARIRVYGCRINLGLFDSKEDAYQAYCDSAFDLHGKFARVK